MADRTTIAQLATAGGTLALAAATFASVRSAHRSARVTERSLLAQLRPVLVPTRLGDPVEKIGFVGNHWLKVGGQRTISRFSLAPTTTGEWINAVGRHWNIDRGDLR